ncbi:MAG: type I-E CRISPR-associated protein Cas5/CasD [Candidatus Aminicenantes bacterium]|nr:type I-E CRISPR-associated protein Cas5/CasD [Candidatus Aminicenantes bacterium]
MSSDSLFLALRLEGPLQAWGFDSQYNRRSSGLMPTKSAVAGICCAALGYGRGSEEEAEFLVSFREIQMMAISIPRSLKRNYADNERKTDLHGRRLQDYHTVQNTITAEGKTKACHITFRQYLCDVSFGVILSGVPSLLRVIANALENPVWGIWLGRKACIPSAPILAGLRENSEDALHLLIGEIPLESFTYQQDVSTFAEGQDTLPDQPVSFTSDKSTKE